jgi:hypothetical protein
MKNYYLNKAEEKEPCKAAIYAAAQVWCDPEVENYTMDSKLAMAVARRIAPIIDAVELAWGLIANAGEGNWEKENSDWVKAARRWRDEQLNPIMDGRIPKNNNQESI